MLRQRLVSALIMVPLVVLAVLKLDLSWFALLVAAAMLLAAWEWGSLVPLRVNAARIGYLVFILALSLAPASVVAPLVSISPVFLLFFSFLFNRNLEIFSLPIIIGAVTVVIGGILIF